MCNTTRVIAESNAADDQTPASGVPVHQLVGRIPNKHREHNRNCGCWDGETMRQLVMCVCGAAYNWIDVITFNDFRCYDCLNRSSGGEWKMFYSSSDDTLLPSNATDNQGPEKLS